MSPQVRRGRPRSSPRPLGGSSGLLDVAGWSVHVPGLSAADLPGSPDSHACLPEDAKEVLGRKGLLGKEPSTRLALCAVHRALGLPPGPLAESLPYAAGTAVVVASNLGNVETVCSVLSDVRERGGSVVSPLDAPNASSNVIASTLAIRYGFTGPNLAVCSGATAGLDALSLARRLILAGRAPRAVVVGVEPADPVAARLAALRTDAPAPLAAGAGCLLVGEPGAWPHSTGLRLGAVRRTTEPVDRPHPEPGDFYGAAGVIRTAVAAARGEARTIGCGGAEDGWAAVDLTVVGEPTGVPA
ncbi:beta-ketoacyl synthase N-terminal-like domain-containing protein [Streptomyces sp. NBC_01396]|uniref:beta-ketoacyl synthase N-terminal-like domain-containing protein n=1 Tax=Streptomyces sp. NBC_01396 TaxID=2903852 RepID=UPI003249FB47